MTALYIILAIIIIGGILFGTYLIGFDDGVRAERMQHRKLNYIVYEVIEEAQAKENERHSLTHADMVQIETEAINRQKEQQNG